MLFLTQKTSLSSLITLLLLTQDCYTLGLATADFSGFAKVIFGIVFALMLIAMVLVAVGAMLKNKPMNFLSAWRFVVFCLGASTAWVVGSNLNNGYRRIGTGFLGIWYNRMYDSWWGYSNYLSMFKPIMNDGGDEYPGHKNFFNAVFFEILILLAGRGMMVVNRQLRNLGQGLILCVSLRLWVAAFWWFKQESVIASRQEAGETWNRKKFSQWMAWFFSIVCLLLVLEQAATLFMEALKLKNLEGGENRKAAYQQTAQTAANADNKEQKKQATKGKKFKINTL